MPGGIVVYSQQGCAPCQMVKKYLDHFGAEYQVKDRSEYADEMLQVAGTITTPVVVKDTNVVIGYNPKKLSEML